MPRKTERVAFLKEVTLEWSSGNREARISDLSLGGCYVDSIAILPEGTLIRFDLKATDGRAMKFEGKVVYSIHGMGVGVEFTEMTPAKKLFLESLIAAAK